MSHGTHKKAYFETNVINSIVYESINVKRLKSNLLDAGLQPAVGLHAIYELGRTFLKPENQKLGQNFFATIETLEPSYQLSPEFAFQREVDKLHTGSAVLPFLDSVNRLLVQQEVGRLACGYFDERARSFILNREFDIEANFPKQVHSYLEHVRRFTNKKPKDKSNLRFYEQVYKLLESQIPKMIVEILHGRVSPFESKELFYRLEQFPALRSAVRANVYICFICIVHNVRPGKDKIDDYRHIIEASYCDIFLTNDRQLKKTLGIINPNLELRSLTEIFT